MGTPRYRQGRSPTGQTCFVILDAQGQPTQRYCFSEEKAQEIVRKLGGLPSPQHSAPTARSNPPKPRGQVAAARPAPQGVVMQRVPEDPLAGPVAVAIPRPPVATRAPRSLTPAPKSDVARAPAQATPAPVKAAAAPAAKSEPARKTAANAAEDLQARAEKVAKQMEADKGAQTKQAAAKPAPAQSKPQPAPVKAAQAKPAAPVKPTATAAAASKNPVPALRLSASAY